MCRNVNASFSGGNVPSDGIPADNSADDYKNDDKSYNNFKKADFVVGRIGIVILGGVTAVIIVIITGIPAGIKTAAEIGISPVGTSGKISEISKSNS